MSTTVNMSLVLPVAGENGTEGPDYADQLLEALEVIDEHDHTTGKGVKVPTAGLNINADLDFGGFQVEDVGAVLFDDLDVAPTLTTGVYVLDGELYFKDDSGTAVQITDGGGLSLSSLGTIGGDFSTSDATVTYSDSTKSFLFKQDSNKTADIAAGSLFVYENIASAKYNKIKSAASLASDLTFTLPAALPASTLPMTMTSAGVISTSQVTTAQITDANVTTAKIADLNVTTGKINDLAVTTGKLAAGAVTQAKRAALGQQVSSDCESFSNGTAVYEDVPELTVTITTTGRPVIVAIVPASSGVYAMYGSKSANNAGFFVKFKRGSSGVAEFQSVTQATGATFVQCQISTPVFVFDVPSAGTHIYQVQFCAASSSSSAGIADAKLVAFEL